MSAAPITTVYGTATAEACELIDCNRRIQCIRVYAANSDNEMWLDPVQAIRLADLLRELAAKMLDDQI